MERLALVLDTETTGLIENRSTPLEKLPEIIEYYGVLVDLLSGRKVSELHRLIRPRHRLPSMVAIGLRASRTITQITGIRDADLEGKPEFPEVAAEIFRQVEEAPLVIAQNASFDREMIDLEAERMGLQLEWPPVICSIEQTVHLRGYRLSLSALHEHLFGEAFEGAHRARADTEALVRICVELVRRGEL